MRHHHQNRTITADSIKGQRWTLNTGEAFRFTKNRTSDGATLVRAVDLASKQTILSIRGRDTMRFPTTPVLNILARTATRLNAPGNSHRASGAHLKLTEDTDGNYTVSLKVKIDGEPITADTTGRLRNTHGTEREQFTITGHSAKEATAVMRQLTQRAAHLASGTAAQEEIAALTRISSN